MTKNEPLMQQKYLEEWIVSVGSEKFSLDENQLNVLREATKSGQRGLVWFDTFAVSIPHIQAIYRVRREPKYKLEAGEKEDRSLPPDEVSQKVQEMKDKLEGKLKVK